MSPLCVDRVAITAFMEPGIGLLLVWRAESREILRLCLSKPAFDPAGHIRGLLAKGCPNGSHPGREALEDHARAAWSGPESPGPIASGSAMGRREAALSGPRGSLDLSMGYLDLLLTVAPDADEGLPRGPSRRPEPAMVEGWDLAWGGRVHFCGQVEEDEWDSVEERASAVLALLERSELAERTSEASGSGARRL